MITLIDLQCNWHCQDCLSPSISRCLLVDGDQLTHLGNVTIYIHNYVNGNMCACVYKVAAFLELHVLYKMLYDCCFDLKSICVAFTSYDAYSIIC